MAARSASGAIWRNAAARRAVASASVIGSPGSLALPRQWPRTGIRQGYDRPGRKFLEQQALPADAGGYRLVAIVSGAREELVAEAGYALLPDGNGEFALTVARSWRGSLGPYLLDAIVAAAAARGVPSLQADILACNPRMLALVSHRGYVTLHREAAELRIAIDAAQPRPGRP
jgi:hypothetical protein